MKQITIDWVTYNRELKDQYHSGFFDGIENACEFLKECKFGNCYCDGMRYFNEQDLQLPVIKEFIEIANKVAGHEKPSILD